MDISFPFFSGENLAYSFRILSSISILDAPRSELVALLEMGCFLLEFSVFFFNRLRGPLFDNIIVHALFYTNFKTEVLKPFLAACWFMYDSIR